MILISTTMESFPEVGPNHNLVGSSRIVRFGRPAAWFSCPDGGPVSVMDTQRQRN